MKNRHLVVWVGGVLGINAVVACAPEVMVSKDDVAGEGGTDVVTTVGGTSSVAGHGGTGPSQGGSSNAGSSAVAAGRGGTGGDESLGSAGALPEVPENCPCTRRPGAPVSRYCPRGADVSNEVTIGREGGDAELSGTASTVGVPFRVRVPAGAVSADTKIVLAETTVTPPDELFDVSPVYSFDTDGNPLGWGAEISIPWTVPSGPVPQELYIYYATLGSPNGRWSALSESYTNAGFEQATLRGPGYYVVGYPRTDDLAACP